MKADLQCEGWDVKTCLYPDPVVPASKDTSGSDSNEQEGEEGRGTPGQRKAAEGARASNSQSREKWAGDAVRSASRG